jgi:prepilin-type processing-associated H-X9-DG protein
LAAILFPVFARARENARRSSCQSNQKQIALGIIQYTQDYDERMPSHWAGGVDTNLQWIHVLQPYMKSKQVFFCPSASSKKSGDPVSTANIAYGLNYSYDATNGVSGRPISVITYPAETILIADTGLNASAYVIIGNSTTQLPNDMHLEGCNFAFVDGHVKWMKSGPVIAKTPTNLWDIN